MNGSKIIKIEEIWRQEFDPEEIDPQALLPILNKWRAAEPDKYRSLINIICASADITPQSLTTGNRRRRSWQRLLQQPQ